MKEDKKLIYICNRVFWPPIGGHEVEMFHYCRGLHDSYGYSIDVFIFEDKENIPSDKPSFINQVFVSDPITKVEKVRNILTKTLFRGSSNWPIQCSLYYSKKNASKLHSLIDDSYDAIIVDMIRLAPYYSSFCNCGAKKILDIDDMLSKRYRRQLESLGKKTNIAGQYNDRLPSFLRRILKSSLIKKTVLKLEIPRMENAEKEYSGLYDNVIFVSELETDEFNRSNGTDKAVTVSLGVDYEYFSSPSADLGQEEGTAAFVGNMRTAANADSIRMIVNDVLPFSSEIKKLIVLGDCPDDLREEFKTNTVVEFKGKVDDLRVHVKKCMVFLSPLAYGTGIKTKILEAMAMGVPVVTNSIGAEGIPGIDGTDWYVSDDEKDLAGKLDYLLKNSKERLRLVDNARQLVRDKFQWEYIFRQFSKLGL